MKKKTVMNRTICVIATCALALTCRYQPAFATEATKDVSKEISAIRGSVISADVLLAPHNMETRGEVQEKDLPARSCTYHVTEKKDLDPLIDLLANAGIVEVAAADPYEMRIAVYLHTRAGTSLGIATSQEFNNAPARGLFNRTVPIATKVGFESGLRAWAAQREAPIKSGRCRQSHTSITLQEP